MKIRSFLMLLTVLFSQAIWACPTCDKQQPEITQGLTHGAGPQSNWDWAIISIITVITVLTLIYSIKYLIKPGEKNTDHIKQSIFSN